MTRRRREPAIETPCTRVCTIDPQTRLCIGCLRSLDEIAAWRRMSPQERRAVMAELSSRALRLQASAASAEGEKE